MQEERNAAINSVAMAISSNEDLKAANIDLYNQLELMGHEKRQAERRITHQRDEYQAREEILRQRAREAKHATAIAEQAMKEAARRDSEAQEAAEREAAARRREQLEMERQEMERVVKERAEEEREEQRRLEIKWEFDRCVEEELRKIRPDLFVGRTEPFTVPSATATKTRTVEVDGRKRVIALPKSRRSRRPPPGESSEAEIVPEQKGKGKAQQPKSLKHATATAAGPDDSTYSISPEEIRRIAQEINAERKKRKAAVAAEKARQGTERKQTEQATTTHPETETVEPKKTKGRKVVKAVYLMEGDTTEIRQLEQEIQSGAAASETANRTIQEIVVEEEAEHEKGQETTALVEVESAAQPDTAPRATPQAPSVDVQFDHASLENHDPRQCTVCVRYEAIRLREEEQERENPLKDIDNSCLLPAPELDPVSKRSRGEGPYEEESTDRPSVDPKTQLERVVRQLRDEFKHLKL